MWYICFKIHVEFSIVYHKIPSCCRTLGHVSETVEQCPVHLYTDIRGYIGQAPLGP